MYLSIVKMGCRKLTYYNEVEKTASGNLFFSAESPLKKSGRSIFLDVEGNHLGNVLMVLSDKKLPIFSVSNSTEVDFFIGEILSASDYSAFGCALAERGFSSSKYRYGFNSMEKDDEVKGENNSYDFGARTYDNRLGRWLSIDPLFKNYPSYSSYNYVLNAPICNTDPDGKRTYFAPGLGNDPKKPAPYVKGVKEAFAKFLGDEFKLLENSNIGLKGDMGFAIKWGSKPMLKSSDHVIVSNAVRDISLDIANNPIPAGDNFNLVGTSMGSITAAQTAITLLEEGVVERIDNLVLVGSPIDQDSRLYKKLLKLKEEGKIGQILYDNYQLEGDLVNEVAGKSPFATVLKGLKVMKSFIQHDRGKKVDVHAALAEDFDFGEDIAKMVLGYDKIEKDKVSADVLENANSSISRNKETGKFQKPRSRPSF